MSMDTSAFTAHESNIRSYCRSFPVVFQKAKGSFLYDEEGRRYIDFFAGAGALNYGHNHDFIKEKIIQHIQNDFVMHALDMFTVAKRELLTKFHDTILGPRGLEYKVQFTGPTGTNAVEAALKIARKVTGRRGVFAFQGGFHGMSLGALACTGNKYNRNGANVDLPNVTFMPYPHGFTASFDTIEYMEYVLNDENSGIETPAAVILETVQAEGGVVVAPVEWLKRLRALCDRHGILVIVDDIQIGCGRSGNFFSFERAGIYPDIVVLSKSIGGFGLPLSLLLLKPSVDQWKPGEHNGTFRGNQLAFVGATAALDVWQNEAIQKGTEARAEWVLNFLNKNIQSQESKLEIRGLGLIWGIETAALGQSDVSASVAKKCFEHGLVIERAGRGDSVIKLLPPLNIPMEALKEGCEIIAHSFKEVLG